MKKKQKELKLLIAQTNLFLKARMSLIVDDICDSGNFTIPLLRKSFKDIQK